MSGQSVQNANFPTDAEGRTYHVGTRKGEVANRVLTCGSHGRARMIAGLFDKKEGKDAFVDVPSNRGFHTYTGTYKGTPVSVVATGMGLPMVDMMTREIAACVEGPMLFCRLGTCGTPLARVKVGSMCVAEEAVLLTRNYDAFGAASESKKQLGVYYTMSKPFRADAALTANLAAALKKEIKDFPVVVGQGATCCSFYSSQGRTNADFDDKNETLIDELITARPNTVCIEMETGHLYHLAGCSTGRDIRASACAIAIAQRKSNDFLPKDKIKAMERAGAIGVLEALIATPLSKAVVKKQ